MKRKALIAAGWLFAGYLAHGYALGNFTHEFPWDRHEPFVTAWSYAGGPVALTIAYLESETHPYRQFGLPLEERWKAYHQKFPMHTRAEFDQENF